MSNDNSTLAQKSLSTRVGGLPPELFFICSASAQYIGAVIAFRLFDRLAPESVAWLRVIAASLILIIFSFFSVFIVIGSDVFLNLRFLVLSSILTSSTDIIGKFDNTSITVIAIFFIIAGVFILLGLDWYHKTKTLKNGDKVQVKANVTDDSENND
mgnify:CR=1 FL=1